jgi:hypothetical protein
MNRESFKIETFKASNEVGCYELVAMDMERGDSDLFYVTVLYFAWRD